MITVPFDSNYLIYYIQAILNSKYLEWITSLNGEVLEEDILLEEQKYCKTYL